MADGTPPLSHDGHPPPNSSGEAPTRAELVGRPGATLPHDWGGRGAPTLGAGPDGPGPVSAPPGYTIEGVLGRGGMAIVYKAQQQGLNRHVALKMISGALDERAVIRFLAESEAVAAIRHPNVVEVYHYGEHNGVPFLTLEYCAGGSLVDHLKRGKSFAPREAAELLARIAHGVQAAHAQGIIHRDLKPGNVLLTEAGEPKVTDFGLAKKGEGSNLTQTVAVLGTPAYMPPEQAKGHTRFLGPQADVWALGVMLYELLCGCRPFGADDGWAVLAAVQRGEFAPPRAIRPGVPRDLELIALKCLRQEPHERYATAGDLAADLENWLCGRPITARPVGAAERAWQWCRRNPAVASLACVALLLLLAVAVTASVFSVQLGRALAQSESEREKAEEQRDLAAKAERQRRRELHSALVAHARANRMSRQIGQRFKSIDAIKQALKLARELGLPAEAVDRLRDEAIAALALPDLRPAEWVEQPAGEKWMRFCFDIDGHSRNYAVASTDGDLFLGRTGGDVGRLDWVARLPKLGQAAYAWWSPDGRFLARNGGRLEVWRTDQGQPRRLFQHAAASSYGFSADSKFFYAIHDTTLRLFELPAGRLVRGIPVPAKITSSACRPGYEQIAVGTAGGIHLIGLDGGRLLKSWPSVGHPGWIDWAPDGESLAVASLDRIHLFSVDRPGAKAVLEHRGNGLSIGHNSDGSMLASVGWDGRLRVWDAVTAQPIFTTVVRPGNWLRFGGRNRLNLAFPEDARPDAWRLTEVAPSPVYRTLVVGAPVGPSPFLSANVHPGGRLLAACTWNGVSLLDIETGRELRSYHLSRAGHLVMSPSGEMSAGNQADRAVRHWAVETDAERPGGLRLRTWADDAGKWAPWPMAVSHDGTRLATILPEGPYVWKAGSASGRLLGPATEELMSVALSPDGKLLAAGTREGSGVRVWDTDTGKVVTALPDHGNKTAVVFSPDGRWVTTSKGKTWRVGTWEAAPSLPPGVPAYSPDGKLLALAEPSGSIVLARPGTGRILARLLDPAGAGAACLTFTPDGCRLVAASDDSKALHLWDLRRLRQELAGLGLDWEGPAYPPESGLGRAAPFVLTDVPDGKGKVVMEASMTASLSSPAGAMDGDRFGTEASKSWQGKPGQGPWWWAVRFPRPRLVGSILQVQGDHEFAFRNAPADYVWQGSEDGRTWHDLPGTAVRGERRMFRLHRLEGARKLLAVRLRITKAEGAFPTLREAEFFEATGARVDFPPWAVVVSTTGEKKVPGEGMLFVPLARSCKGYSGLQAQNVWLGDFHPRFLEAEPRPLCGFLSGNFIDWCQQKREHWRGTQDVLRQGHLPLWAACGGAQGLAILAEHGLEQPWDCPHCRDPKNPRTTIYTHIGHTGKRPCGDYSACLFERGPHNILQVAEDPAFAGLPREFKAPESHCGQIARAPKGWVLIAAGGKGALTRVQCLRVKDRPIYAAQFHIELPGSPATSRAIMGNFLAQARAWGGHNPKGRPVPEPRPLSEVPKGR